MAQFDAADCADESGIKGAQGMTTEQDLEATAARLQDRGVVGLTIAWVDNNGITRSRTAPIERLATVALAGIGITTLFAVFDSHDGITFAHEGLPNASGDIRLIPDLDAMTRLAGQPAFAWAPGNQRTADGGPWPYDQRAVLERQVRRAADAGLELRCGFELEMFVSHEGDEPVAAHRGPAYGPKALLDVDEFVAAALTDLAANGIQVGQVHAEVGSAQLELSIVASDPLATADRQVLARQTLHAAARRHGLRLSLAPLTSPDGVGNGCHIHSSAWRDGQNLLVAGSDGRPTGVGASYIAGLLRELPAIAGITAPSVPSLTRLRPGYFASAFAFWGIENREAALRYVPDSELLGPGNANVELKAADASGNPYLALAVLIAAGLAGIEDGLALPEPIADDPGRWSEEERRRASLAPLPATPGDQRLALETSPMIREVLSEPLFGAFLAVRDADAAWAAERSLDEIVAAHLWLY
jgi:glutamine synthetase